MGLWRITVVTRFGAGTHQNATAAAIAASTTTSDPGDLTLVAEAADGEIWIDVV